MGAIQEIISLMSEAERKGFVQHLASRNKRHDTRNIDLFKALTNNKERELKTAIGDNAYNVLKKRLSDRLLDYLAGITLEAEANQEVIIIKQLLIARKLFSHRKYKLAFTQLSKAERNAVTISHYSLLNEIYHTYIQYSYLDASPEQESVFRRFEENKQDLAEQEQLNMAYAVIRKAFNTMEYNAEPVNLQKRIEESFERFGVSAQRAYNFQSLFQLAEIADVSGAYSKNYYAVDLFFVDKVRELQGGAGDTEKYLIYHIDVLYLIANIYFRKKMFAKSRVYLDEMYKQMLRYNKKFYKERKVKYATLLALNHNYSGNYQKAIITLEALINSKQYALNALLNPYLALSMIHFQQENLLIAKQLLAKFQHADSWYEKYIGVEWTLHKKYVEILLHIELGNVDFVDSRITSMVRKYGELFKTNKESQVIPFLKLVKKYYQHPDTVQSDGFKKDVEKSINWKPAEQEDIFLMSFYAWLKSKMDQKSIYTTTLELISTKNL